MTRTSSLTAVAVAALMLAACGGSATATQDANNVRVCKHYRTQRAWVKNLAKPTLADGLKFLTWVAADAAEATPGTPLAKDLNAMSKAQRDAKAPQSAVYNASTRVLKDCTTLGVTFQP